MRLKKIEGSTICTAQGRKPFNMKKDVFVLDLLDQTEMLLGRKAEQDRNYEYDDL